MRKKRFSKRGRKMEKKSVTICLIVILLGTTIGSSQITEETGIIMENNPPNPPSDPYPENESTNVSINILLSWTGGDPDGDPVTYDVFFGIISAPPKVTTNQSTTFYDPGALNYSVTYYWQIVAWDNQSASTTGPIWSFTTGYTQNNPPSNPIGLNPSWWLPAEDYHLIVSASDPDDDDVYFFVDWGDGNTSGWSGPYEPDLEATLIHNWSNEGNYTITVKTRDAAGMLSMGNYSFVIQIFEIRGNLEKAIIIGNIHNRKPIGDYIYFTVETIAYIRFPGRLIFPNVETEIAVIYKYIGMIIEGPPDFIIGFFNAVIISDIWPR